MNEEFLRWQVGDVRITRVVDDLDTWIGKHILPMATPEALAPTSWLQPHFVDAEGVIILSLHALVVETAAATILVDTCLGNDKPRAIEQWSMRSSDFLSDLTRAGFDPATIDIVLCTHLHIDHVGFNTTLCDGKWVPTFPNARYLFARVEWEHWKNEPEDLGPVISDSVRPIIDAGLADLVEMNHQVTPEVSLQPTPGHTPGHVSVDIRSKGERAAITGDMIHHPCQIAHPEWSSTADTDGELSYETRRKFLEQHADRSSLVIGTHFAGPTAGTVVRDGNAYKLIT